MAPLILGGLALVVVVLLLWRFPEFGGDVPGEGSGVSTQPAEESSPAEGVPIPETGQLPQSISDSMLPSSKLSPSWNPWVQDLSARIDVSNLSARWGIAPDEMGDVEQKGFEWSGGEDLRPWRRSLVGVEPGTQNRIELVFLRAGFEDVGPGGFAGVQWTGSRAKWKERGLEPGKGSRGDGWVGPNGCTSTGSREMCFWVLESGSRFRSG